MMKQCTLLQQKLSQHLPPQIVVGPRLHRAHCWRVAIERSRERFHRGETLARPDGDPSGVRGKHPHPRRKHVEHGGGRCCALSLLVASSYLGARAEWPKELNLGADRIVSASANTRSASSSSHAGSGRNAGALTMYTPLRAGTGGSRGW